MLKEVIYVLQDRVDAFNFFSKTDEHVFYLIAIWTFVTDYEHET